MNRKSVIYLVIYGLILAGFAGLKGEILALAVPFIIYLVIGFLDSPSDPNLLIKREFESVRVLPRTPVAVNLIITNQGKKFDLLLIEDVNLSGLKIIRGSAKKVCRLAPGEKTELSYAVSGARGIYRFDHVDVKILGKLGLFELKKTLVTSGQIFILPDVPQLKRLVFRNLQTRVYSGNHPARVAGSGTDFFGVRSYQPGDPLKYINWRLSARFPDSFFSNEFERERVSDIWLVLDGRQRSNLRNDNSGLFEHIILAGAGLARALLNEGNRMGLLIYGGYLQWTFPGYGKIQRERIFQSLAQAQPGNLYIFSDLDNLPTRVFPLTAQLIFISPLHPEDIPVLLNLRARGYPILIISPDPVSYETGVLIKEEGGEPALRIAMVERRLLLKRLLNAGIQVINWNVSIPFEIAVQSRLRHAMWRFHPQRQLR